MGLSVLVVTFLIIFALLFVLSLLVRGVGSLFSRWQPIEKFWQSRSSFFHRLLPNLIIGLTFLYLIIVFPHIIPRLANVEDLTMDFMMEVYSSIPPSTKKKMPPFVLLDIDDTTYKNWGKPPFTPRDKLKNLINTAVEAKARLIIVDIDVSKAAPSINGSLHPHDQALKTYLADYVTQCQAKENQSDCVRIIFVRAFGTGSGSVRVPRTSFLENGVTTQLAPYVQWGSAQFPLSAGHVIRHWRLWESTCINEQPGVTPSIELLVMGMIRECTTKDIQKALQPFQPKNCNDNKISLPASLTFCGLTISTNSQSSVQQRVMYHIPWNRPTLPHIVSDKNGDPILTIFPARFYAESQPQADVGTFTDSIVVIGGSYRGDHGSDVHLVPIGEMPGAMIIINAVYSLVQNKIVKPVSASIWIWLIIAIFFIVIITKISYFSLWYKVLGVSVIITILILVFIASIFLFEDGTWLNIAIPLLILQFYLEIYPKVREYEKKVSQKGNKMVSWVTSKLRRSI